MGKLCKKCGYERQVSDIAPDYECPKCGAIYAKVEARLKSQAETLNQQNAKTKRPKKPESTKTKARAKEGARKPRSIFLKVIAGFFGGLILAILGALLITVTFAASPEKGGSWGAAAFFIIWIIGIIGAILSPSPPKAWRRLLVSSAVVSLLLPLSGLIYTGSFMAKNVDPSVDYAGAHAAGAAIGGGLVSGFMGFVGFFLGIVFLIIGLLVGRDKQVVYVRAANNSDEP